MKKIFLGLMLLVSFGFGDTKLDLVNNILKSSKECRGESRYLKSANVKVCFKYIDYVEELLEKYPNDFMSSMAKNDLFNIGYRNAYAMCFKQNDWNCVKGIVEDIKKYGLSQNDLTDIATNTKKYENGKMINLK